MDFEEALALVTRELNAVPIPLEVLRVDLWAPRMTPADGAVLADMLAAYPGEHPVQVTLHNGTGGKTLLMPEMTVDLAVAGPIADYFGAWAVGL